MKNRIFTLVALMLAVGCAKNEDVADKSPVANLTAEQVNALRYQSGERTISMDEITSYAEFAIATLDSKHPTRSGKRSIEAMYPVVEQTAIKTRSGESVVNDTTMYIANFADSMGYTVISCDVLAPGPIAIIEQGSLGSIDQAGNNAALNLALKANKAKKQSLVIKYAGITRCDEQPDHIHDNDKYYYKHSGWQITYSATLLRTKWNNYVGFANHCGQISPCKHFVDPTTAAPALAQLAYYYKIDGYVWNPDMEIFRGIINFDPVSDASIKTIRDLYADIYRSVKIDGSEKCTNSACSYRMHGLTAANWPKVKAKASQLFNISNTSTAFDATYLLLQVKANKPVLMSGYPSSTVDRQYWIADGYTTAIMNCDKYDIATNALITPSETSCCYPLIHCAMGIYGGNGDGYYDLGEIPYMISQVTPSASNYASDIEVLYFDNPVPAAIN